MNLSKRKRQRELSECYEKTKWYIDRLASYLAPIFKIPKEDLQQEGFLGMIRAQELYNPEISSFITYSQYWIKTYMFGLAYKNSFIITIPEEFHFIYSRYKKRYAEIKDVPIEGRLPLLAKEFGVSESRLKKIVGTVSAMKRGCPLESADYYCNDLSDDLYDKASDSSGNLIAILKRAVTPEEYFVIDHMLALECPTPKTLNWVGKILGVTKERVRQIKNAGLDKFKKVMLEVYGEDKDVFQ